MNHPNTPPPVEPQVSLPRLGLMQLRGGRVHNLQNIDLDIPLGQCVVITGVSGSGKTSLAFDTFFAEGQRRYVESFPVYARRFLPKFDRPDADLIANVPPALAVSQGQRPSDQTEVATAAGIADFARLLFARFSTIHCPTCGRQVLPATPETMWSELATEFATADKPRDDEPVLVAFPLGEIDDPSETWKLLREQGFLRVEHAGTIYRTDAAPPTQFRPPSTPGATASWRVVVDRLTWGAAPQSRWIEALETALRAGLGHVHVLVRGHWWERAARLRCGACQLDFRDLAPNHFLTTHPETVCQVCKGQAVQRGFDRTKVLDPSRSLRQKAVVPLADATLNAEWEQFLGAAQQAGFALDVPLGSFSQPENDRFWRGDFGGEFPGVAALLAELAPRRAKGRKSWERFQSPQPCPHCQGKGFGPEVLARQLQGRDWGDLRRMSVGEARAYIAEITANAPKPMLLLLNRLSGRLRYLADVGLDYLGLDRRVETLSRGEAQRLALTTILGSDLSRALFVLDEPSAGLHPRDTARLLTALRGLLSAGNSVLLVEHDPEAVMVADQVIDLGPGAGAEGGRIIFQGAPHELAKQAHSAMAPHLRAAPPIFPRQRRQPRRALRLRGAHAHHLRHLNVDFPLHILGVLCGVSGSGKSSLLLDTLYPAVARSLGEEPLTAVYYEQLDGAEGVDEVVLVDGDAMGRSPRANAVTYLKIFDEIRKQFAETLEARLRGLTPNEFSFNADSGRCSRCEGLGVLAVDMQFLPTTRVTCPECGGTRYQRRVLDVKYRGRNIAEVLDLTVREAFAFFRGLPKIQERLRSLYDVGLSYLRLGQSTDTLSGGEAQRLKLASYLTAKASNHTLFLFDEPTIGLHPNDVLVLLQCLDSLLALGHSVWVIEHHPLVVEAADYIIELGPDAGSAGGEVIAHGTHDTWLTQATVTAQALHRWRGSAVSRP